MPETVVEVVLVVPRQRVHAVAQQAPLGPLPRPRKVRLEGARAGVLRGNQVRIVRPHVLEECLEAGRDLDGLAGLQDGESLEDVVQGPFRQHALHDVRPVQAVDAVRPEDARLVGHDRSIATRVLDIELVLFVRHAVDEDVEAVVLHLAALGVEVEGLVAHRWIVQLLDQGVVGLLQDVLGASLVDQVDQHLLAVVAQLRVKVFGEGAQVVTAGHDFRRRLVLEVGRLTPVQGNAATGLEGEIINLS